MWVVIRRIERQKMKKKGMEQKKKEGKGESETIGYNIKAHYGTLIGFIS